MSYIRKEYLFDYRHKVHKVEKHKARTQAIEAERGDRKVEEYFSEVSEDDTIWTYWLTKKKWGWGG